MPLTPILNRGFYLTIGMKYKAEGQGDAKGELQAILDQENALQAALMHIEMQISDFENAHLEHSWQDGNLYLGWTRSLSAGSLNGGKIKINAKEKLFTMSSVTSKDYAELNDVADKNLSPYG